MKYEDFKKDTAYHVVSGENDDLKTGDLFWISSRDGALVLAGGWLEEDEIPQDIFDSVEIKQAYEYVTIRNEDGRVEIVHQSAIQSRWIKVTPDTMPPDMQEVIVTFENEKKERDVQLQARWNGKHGHWEFLGYDWEEVREPYYKVTHWMPMPKPAED